VPYWATDAGARAHPTRGSCSAWNRPIDCRPRSCRLYLGEIGSSRRNRGLWAPASAVRSLLEADWHALLALCRARRLLLAGWCRRLAHPDLADDRPLEQPAPIHTRFQEDDTFAKILEPGAAALAFSPSAIRLAPRRRISRRSSSRHPDGPFHAIARWRRPYKGPALPRPPPRRSDLALRTERATCRVSACMTAEITVALRRE